MRTNIRCCVEGGTDWRIKKVSNKEKRQVISVFDTSTKVSNMDYFRISLIIREEK